MRATPITCHDCGGDGEAPQSMLGACLICPSCGGAGVVTPKCDCHEKFPTWPVFRKNYHVDGCPYREIEKLAARVADLEAELYLPEEKS